MKKKTIKKGAPKKKDVVKEARANLFTGLLKALKEDIGVENDTDLAKVISPNENEKNIQQKKSMINNWKTGGSIGEKAEIAFLKSAARAFFAKAYQVIAEMEPIKVLDSSLRSRQKEMDFYSSKMEMKKLLDKSKGIYIFYDSLGKAIYAGKTEKNTLWMEMKSAYNRERKTQQKFKRTSGIKISKRPYYLYEVADYVSVYSVKPYAIGFIEALLIHSFPNDLTNVCVEKNGKLKFEDKIEKKKVETKNEKVKT
jgi:hypothetical protein